MMESQIWKGLNLFFFVYIDILKKVGKIPKIIKEFAIYVCELFSNEFAYTKWMCVCLKIEA
jgi:hypothetical protein